MKLLVVAGARPNFMKVAPILKALRSRQLENPNLEVRLIHTGQHYDHRMSDSFFEELNIPHPDVNLEVGSGSHAQQTARIMMAFESVCEEERPDWLIVVGDVNSTIACALTAKKMGIRVAHVEAGLRSRDMKMPEEVNRLCTDAISDLLFTTDLGANANLRAEGVAPERVRFVGNTMIDTLLEHVEHARELPLPPGLEAGGYAVLTLHRPSNVDDPGQLRRLFAAIGSVADRLPVVFPVHPRTLSKLAEVTLHPNILIQEPMSYLAFLGLVARARLVMTDSGGIQEETTVLGIPCLTMRNNTERPITCEVGTNVLAGADPARIRRIALELLDAPPRGWSIPDKWDGKSAGRIADALLSSPAPERSRRRVSSEPVSA
jgi:UDP-N-acetylglucosamine 2-epimerase (non-hydrolysing)